MTDDAYDAQTLATSARIERLHRLRFGVTPCFRARYCGDGERITFPFYDSDGFKVFFGPPPRVHFNHYGASDPEELIYSRAN